MFVEEDFDEYLADRSKNGVWGDNLEMQGLAEIFDRPVEVYSREAPVSADGRLEPLIVLLEESTRNVAPIRLTYGSGWGSGLRGQASGSGFRLHTPHAHLHTKRSGTTGVVTTTPWSTPPRPLRWACSARRTFVTCGPIAVHGTRSLLQMQTVEWPSPEKRRSGQNFLVWTRTSLEQAALLRRR